MEGKESPDQSSSIDPNIVLEVFSAILKRLGATPQVAASPLPFGDNPKSPLVDLAEVILSIQIILRDFLKRLFTSRWRAIQSDLHVAAVDMCIAISGAWQGDPVDRVLTMCAVVTELYLYCDCVGIPVPDDFFLQLWIAGISEDFRETIIFANGAFQLGDPIYTRYYEDYHVLSPYIDDLSTPYQSVSVKSIGDIRISYDILHTQICNVFDYESTLNTEGCPDEFRRRIFESLSDMLSWTRGAASRRTVDVEEDTEESYSSTDSRSQTEGPPFTVIEDETGAGPSFAFTQAEIEREEGPSTVAQEEKEEGPSTVAQEEKEEGPSTVAHEEREEDPSTVAHKKRKKDPSTVAQEEREEDPSIVSHEERKKPLDC